MLEPAAERPESGLRPSGDHAQGGEGEQAGDLLGVCAELVPSALERRAGLTGHLELDESERQPVDVGERVGAPRPASLLDRDLVDHDEVVAIGLVDVHEPGHVVPRPTVAAAPLDGHPLRHQPMHPPVLGEHVAALGSAHGRDDLGDLIGPETRVELLHGPAQPALQQHVPVRRPLSCRLARGDDWAVEDLPAEVVEVLQADLLDAGLRDERLHSASWGKSRSRGAPA